MWLSENWVYYINKVYKLLMHDYFIITEFFIFYLINLLFLNFSLTRVPINDVLTDFFALCKLSYRLIRALSKARPDLFINFPMIYFASLHTVLKIVLNVSYNLLNFVLDFLHSIVTGFRTRPAFLDRPWGSVAVCHAVVAFCDQDFVLWLNRSSKLKTLLLKSFTDFSKKKVHLYFTSFNNIILILNNQVLH